MIKTAISALVVSTIALSSPAFAAVTPDTGTVNISGSVAKKCKFTGTNPESIDLGELANSDGKLADGKVTGTKTLTAWCNAPATVSVTANPIKAQTALASSLFTNRVEYKATATIGAVTADDETDATDQVAGTAKDLGVFSGNVDVSISNGSTVGDLLLVADESYKGSVTVTLTPKAL